MESPGRVALLDLTHLDRPAVILEDTAAAIWNHLEEPISEGALAAAVAAEYGADVPDIEPAVADFLARLGELGLIEPT